MPARKLTRTARQLRRDTTEAEKLLWSSLRASQLDDTKFVRQLPVGPFIVDFACRSAKLVIELDGGQHAENSANAERTRIIEGFGYRVIRFWNHDVLTNVDGVLTAIRMELHLARNLLP